MLHNLHIQPSIYQSKPLLLHTYFYIHYQIRFNPLRGKKVAKEIGTIRVIFN